MAAMTMTRRYMQHQHKTSYVHGGNNKQQPVQVLCQGAEFGRPARARRLGRLQAQGLWDPQLRRMHDSGKFQSCMHERNLVMLRKNDCPLRRPLLESERVACPHPRIQAPEPLNRTKPPPKLAVEPSKKRLVIQRSQASEGRLFEFVSCKKNQPSPLARCVSHASIGRKPKIFWTCGDATSIFACVCCRRNY